MKKFSILAILFLAACTPSSPASNDVEPQAAELPTLAGMPTIDPNEVMDGEVVTIFVHPINSLSGQDTLVDVMHISIEDMVFPIELTTSEPGQMMAYAPSGDDDTLALFFSYWAGIGDVYRIRHIGMTLVVEHMEIAEPSAEDGIACAPWEEFATVDIGLAQDFSVQPDQGDLEPFPEHLECDCQDNLCVNFE